MNAVQCTGMMNPSASSDVLNLFLSEKQGGKSHFKKHSFRCIRDLEILHSLPP